MKTIVVTPTYNEAEHLSNLVEVILSLNIDNLGILIVDDNSPDGTGQIADNLAEKYPHKIEVIHRQGKLGLGTAYVAGFTHALEEGAEAIIQMDADLSHPPESIPKLLEQIGTYDVVIGARYVRGGGTRYCTLPRKALSWGANAFAKIVLWLQAMDCTAGFRCYRREVLESIDLDTIFSNGYSFLIEMLYRVQRRGWRVAEVPIIFENRRRGASKISRQEILRAMYTVVHLGQERLFGSAPTPAASQQR